MPDLYIIIENINAFLLALPFSPCVLLLIASFAVIFVIALAACLVSPAVREADKRPFFHYLNLYTALLFAVLSANIGAASSAAPSALFWTAGYIMYGALCAVTKKRKRMPEISHAAAAIPAAVQYKPPVRPEVPAAKLNVRLEHAMGIADKLLARDIGRSDRQELEKIKSSLGILQGKGALTPQESDILNDNFNALLKLMARYGE